MGKGRWTRRATAAALGAVETLLSTDFDNGKAQWPDGVANSDMMEARDILASITNGFPRPRKEK